MARVVSATVLWFSAFVSGCYAFVITGTNMDKVPAATQVSTFAIFALVTIISLAIFVMLEVYYHSYANDYEDEED